MVGYCGNFIIVIILGSEFNLDMVDGVVFFRYIDMYIEDDGWVLLGNVIGSWDEKVIEFIEFKDEIMDNS